MDEKVEERDELHDAHTFVLLAPAASLRNRCCRALCPEKKAAGAIALFFLKQCCKDTR